MPAPRIRLFVATLAALSLAACSSEPAGTEEPANAPGEHGSFAQCLTEHGVDESAASPVGPPEGVDPATWEAAMQACSSLAPGPSGP